MDHNVLDRPEADDCHVPGVGSARRQLREFQDIVRERAYKRQQPLHHLFDLISDPATLAFAFDRLLGRYGDRTPGVDRMTFKQVVRGIGRDAFVTRLSHDLRTGNYRAVKMRPVQNNSRTVYIQSVEDRVVEFATKLILDPLAEASYHPHNYGWVSGAGTQNAIRLIKRGGWRYDWAVVVDIADFFDTVPHKLIIRSLKRLVNDDELVALIGKWLKMVGNQNDLGIGAGTIVSNVLANIVLTDIDNLFPTSFSFSPFDGRPDWLRTSGRTGLAALLYVRYGDDIVILSKDGQVQPIKILHTLIDRLGQLGLQLSWEKCSISELAEGFDFLGHRFTKACHHGRDIMVSEPSPAKVNEIVGLVEGLLAPWLGRTMVPDEEVLEVCGRIRSLLQHRLGYYRSTRSDLTELKDRLMSIANSHPTMAGQVLLG